MNPKILIIIIISLIKEVFFIIKAGLCTQGEQLSIASGVEMCTETRGEPPQDSIGARRRAAAGAAHWEESRESGTEKRGMCECRGTCAHVLYQAGTAECQRVCSGTVGQRCLGSLNLLRQKNASESPASASKPGYPDQPLGLVVRTQPASCKLRQQAFQWPLASACQPVFGDFGYAAC